MISEADPDLCDRDPSRIVRHEVVQLLDLVALAGANHRVRTLRLDVTDEDRTAVRDLPADPIVLHLGRRWFSEGSTLDGTLAIVERLASLGPVVITCARDCEQFAAAFEAKRRCAPVARPALSPVGGGFRARSRRRDRRYRCDPRRKRRRKADRRRIRTSLFSAELARMVALRRSSRPGTKAGASR